MNITSPVIRSHQLVQKSIDRTIENNIKQIRRESLYAEENRQFLEEDREYLEAAAEDLNKLIFENNSKFEFEVHEGTNRMMVRLVDKETEEVIREVPPKQILDVIACIWDLVGILVDERG